jgi:site-specific recombinase XerC
MRRAECDGMALDDVDLDQRIVWVLGKDRRPRALPIGRKTAQALDRHLRAREGHRLAVQVTGRGYTRAWVRCLSRSWGVWPFRLRWGRW